MKIPQDKIEQVRMASDIADIVSGYVTLTKRGKNYFGLCPFHPEKTPSFSVNPELQIFHCFGCGAGGNVFTFIMRVERLTFPESVRLLAKAAGIVLPEEEEDLSQLQEKEALFFANNMANDFFVDNLLHAAEAEPARNYLRRRGLDEALYTRFGIGYSLDRWDALLHHAGNKSVNPELLLRAGLVLRKEGGGMYDRFRGRITFAIHNLSNQVVAFGARRIVNDNSPKYVNSPETDVYQKRYVLYGLHLAREAVRRENSVIIVEGYTDLISLHSAGLTAVVATSGTALTDEHARLLRRYTANAFILYDGDSAGAAASLRGADILLGNGFDVRICLLPAGQDPDEFVREKGAEALRSQLGQAMPLMDYKLRLMEQKGMLRTPNQKAESTRDLLSSVAKMADPIQKSFIIRDLGEKLHVEEAVLWSEVRKMEQRLRQQLRPDAPKTEETRGDRFFATRRGAAELGLLEVVFAHPELLPRLIGVLPAGDFLHPDIRAIFEHLELDGLEGVAFEVQRYLTLIQDPAIAGKITRLLQKPDQHTHPERYAFDCFNTIRIAKLDQRIDQLRREMKSGDRPQEEVLQQYRALIDERKHLEQINFAFE